MTGGRFLALSNSDFRVRFREKHCESGGPTREEEQREPLSGEAA
jgi:hypothetical protein